MFVGASTIDTASWDRRTLGEQEAAAGRYKLSVACLDLVDDPRR